MDERKFFIPLPDAALRVHYLKDRVAYCLAEATPLPVGSQRVHVKMKKEVRTIRQVHWEAEVQAPQFA